MIDGASGDDDKLACDEISLGIYSTDRVMHIGNSGL